MSELFREEWTGTSGAWSAAKWKNIYAQVDGVVDLSANTGRMSGGSNAYPNGFAQAQTVDSFSDFDLTVNYNVQTSTTGTANAVYAGLHFRGADDSMINSGAAYRILFEQLATDTLRLQEKATTTWADLDSATYALTAGDVVHIRIIANGSSLKVWVWKNAEGAPDVTSVPATVEATDATLASGFIALTHDNGTDAAIEYAVWDTMVINTIAGAAPAGDELVLTPSTTIGGLVSSFVSRVKKAGNPDDHAVEIFTAAVGPSPTPGTVRVTRTGGDSDQWLNMDLWEITGWGALTNFGSTGGTGATLPVALGSAPASDSVVIGGAYLQGATGATAVGVSGATVRTNDPSTDDRWITWDDQGTLATTYNVSPMTAGSERIGVVLEVKAGSGSTGGTGATAGTVTTRGEFSTTAGVSATTTATSGSFTPTAGNVLVLTAGCYVNAASLTLTASDTFANTAFTQVATAYDADYGPGYTHRSTIWVAVVGASPGAGTATVTRTGGTVDQWLHCTLIELAGVSATIPTNFASVARRGSAGDLTVNLPAEPVAGSILVGAAYFGQDATVTIPAGTTSLANAGTFDSSNAWYDKTALAQANTWTGIGSADVHTAVVIEVFDAP